MAATLSAAACGEARPSWFWKDSSAARVVFTRSPSSCTWRSRNFTWSCASWWPRAFMWRSPSANSAEAMACAICGV